MPRPKSKSELINFSQTNFQFLSDLIDSYSKVDQEKPFPKGTMNRNIRDVLGHLLEWQIMMLEWYRVGMNGEKPTMPAEGYTWKTVPKLNQKIWEKYSTASLKKVRADLEKTHKALQKIVNLHSEKELFEKKHFKWTGSTSLASYLISATSSHYNWAIKLIKKAKK